MAEALIFMATSSSLRGGRDLVSMIVVAFALGMMDALKLVGVDEDILKFDGTVLRE